MLPITIESSSMYKNIRAYLDPQLKIQEFCLKYFRNTGYQNLLAINFLLTKFFKSLY